MTSRYATIIETDAERGAGTLAPVHPGEVLAEFVTPMGLSASAWRVARVRQGLSV